MPHGVPRTIVKPLVKNICLPIFIILARIFFIISKLVVARSRHCDVTRGSYLTEPSSYIYIYIKYQPKIIMAKINLPLSKIAKTKSKSYVWARTFFGPN